MGIAGARFRFQRHSNKIIWLAYALIATGVGFNSNVSAEASLTTAISLASLGEINLPTVSDVTSQGSTPYCQLYALATFLELWANRNSAQDIKIDPAFFGLIYNAEVSDGNTGTFVYQLLPFVQKYGALPKGVKIDEHAKLVWPLKDWQASHRTLMNETDLTPRLTAWYRWRERWIKPDEFFKKEIGVDFSAFTRVTSKHSESYQPSVPSNRSSQVRRSGADLTKRISEVEQEIGWTKGRSTDTLIRNPNAIFTMLAVQLYESSPALVAINPMMGDAKTFDQFKVIEAKDLVAPGAAKFSSHAVVAVAYCETDRPMSALCKKFAGEMKEKGTEECLVMQNSWGNDSNAEGYVCLSRPAFSRVVQWAYLKQDLLGR